MGEILAFSPRPPASDWSANERGLLMLLTQQLATTYGEVDAVFGQTDSGDPWYVVTDDHQDVLVHIARIDGQFVVHDAAVDIFHQVGSLWGALRQVLTPSIDDQTGVVVAFNPVSREAQSFLSLVIAVGLYLELRGVELGEGGRLTFDNLPRIDDPAMADVASKLIAALNLEADRSLAHAAAQVAPSGEIHASPPPMKIVSVNGVTLEAPGEASALQGHDGLPAVQVTHPQAIASIAPGEKVLPQAMAAAATSGEGEFELATMVSGLATDGAQGTSYASAKAYVSGTAGADVLTGTAEGETIAGGAGDDYIDGKGAKSGQLDRIDGGAGDDKIVMNARVVASGSAGADTFLVSAAEPADKASALLGVVLDFMAAKGDHLAVLGQGHLTVVSTQAVNDVLAVQAQTLGDVTTAQVTDVTRVVAGTRVGFDVNGDGHEDVFILLGGANTETFRIGTTIANDHDVQTVPLIGQSTTTDIGGHVGDAPAR